MKCYPLYSARISAARRASRAELQGASDCRWRFWRCFLPGRTLGRYKRRIPCLV